MCPPNKEICCRGLLGGSFDPVHNGHLYLADLARETLQLSDVRFLPARAGAHKKHYYASDQDRLAMLTAALVDRPHDHIDTRDLTRGIPTRTIDTLHELCLLEPETHWVLLLGSDQWADFHRWHRWPEILHRAHIAVLHRNIGSSRPPRMSRPEVQWQERTALREQRAGAVVALTGQQHPGCSTIIRQGHDDQLPPRVRDYIRHHHLYEYTKDGH